MLPHVGKFFPFCRYLIKILSRELNGRQYNATKTLEDLAAFLGRVQSQTTFKILALLGDVEEASKICIAILKC